jgi:hypothetical protein
VTLNPMFHKLSLDPNFLSDLEHKIRVAGVSVSDFEKASTGVALLGRGPDRRNMRLDIGHGRGDTVGSSVPRIKPLLSKNETNCWAPSIMGSCSWYHTAK